MKLPRFELPDEVEALRVPREVNGAQLESSAPEPIPVIVPENGRDSASAATAGVKAVNAVATIRIRTCLIFSLPITRPCVGPEGERNEITDANSMTIC